MEKLKLSEANIEECAARAAAVLRAGGIILYPTDTLYGLGADALSDEAVAKVYALKHREEGKPVHCIVPDLKMAEQYAEVTPTARALARAYMPGALTLILKKKDGIATGVARGFETFGIRIPDNAFCLALAKKFGKPYTTTSANVSGQKSERDVDTILQQLGDNHYASVLQKTAIGIDLVIDAGELPERQPSTVVNLSGEEPVILREGAIPNSEIWNVIRPEV